MTSTLDGRLVHQHAATADACPHYSPTRNRSPPLMATTTGLRYSLSQGKKGMSAAMQKASRSSVALALRRNSSNAPDSETNPACDHVNSTSPVKPSSPSSPSLNIAEMIKVFVLLLEPKTKTFELIQLVYPSTTTTVGDILRMIPQHATELALGSQTYIGLCRPKDEQDHSSLPQLASGCSENSADIKTGEIMVAIPSDYSVPEVAKFSQAILTNRRFTKLLRRNNPLSPKMRKHSDRKKDRKHKHKHKHRSRDAVHILEKHDEMPEDATADDDQMMQRALQKAANAAAQANANIPVSPSSPRSSRSKSKSPEENTISLSRHLQRHSNRRHHSPARSDAASIESSPSYDSSYASFSWIDGGASTYSNSTAGDSLGESISSWSKSLDASFATTGRAPQSSRHRHVSGGSPNKLARNQQKSGSLFWVGAAAVVALAYLLGSFLMDPKHLDMNKRTETAKNSPMGLAGLLSVILMLCVLKKIQFLSNRRQRKNYNNNHHHHNSSIYIQKAPHQSPCPAVRIYAKWNKVFS